MSADPLSSMPTEILEDLSSYLPRRDVESLSRVSEKLRNHYLSFVERVREVAKEKTIKLTKDETDRTFADYPLLLSFFPSKARIFHVVPLRKVIQSSGNITIKGRGYRDFFFGPVTLSFQSTGRTRTRLEATMFFNEDSLLDGKYTINVDYVSNDTIVQYHHNLMITMDNGLANGSYYFIQTYLDLDGDVTKPNLITYGKYKDDVQVGYEYTYFIGNQGSNEATYRDVLLNPSRYRLKNTTHYEGNVKFYNNKPSEENINLWDDITYVHLINPPQFLSRFQDEVYDENWDSYISLSNQGEFSSSRIASIIKRIYKKIENRLSQDDLRFYHAEILLFPTGYVINLTYKDTRGREGNMRIKGNFPSKT